VRAVDIIRAKREGQSLSRSEIDAFISGLSDGSWADYQVSALLMAIVLRGMTPEETAWLTDAMVRSGRRLDLSALPGIKVGKHSTGGVGDKVSIVLAPIVAACGGIVPKMSGRGLGHTGGTLDKLEAIPGFRVALTLDEFLAVLGEVGCCLISQTKDIVPADKKLYALRDVTATIESIPLISASVMSKKIAEGSNAVVLDVKCGSGAFMKREDDARALARSLVAIGNANGVRTEAFVTSMDAPLGSAVGNALEIAECVETLKGNGPADLRAIVIRLASRMLELGQHAADAASAETQVRAALSSGRAFERFEAMVRRQGGDPAALHDLAKLPQARERRPIRAAVSGVVTQVDAESVGRASVLLGAGRDRVDAAVDLAAGVVVLRKPGDRVSAGDPVMELHFNTGRVDEAAELAAGAITIGDETPVHPPLIRDHVH
jgi:pyrimidine-nucleoside phosphorylase